MRVILNGIPQIARDRGVYPEDALRERFIKVEKIARDLALVPEQGARLHIYILSYIQSLLLLKAASPIPQAELNDEAVDFKKLSTNEILQRARYIKYKLLQFKFIQMSKINFMSTIPINSKATLQRKFR